MVVKGSVCLPFILTIHFKIRLKSSRYKFSVKIGVLKLTIIPKKRPELAHFYYFKSRTILSYKDSKQSKILTLMDHSCLVSFINPNLPCVSTMKAIEIQTLIQRVVRYNALTVMPRQDEILNGQPRLSKSTFILIKTMHL